MAVERRLRRVPLGFCGRRVVRREAVTEERLDGARLRGVVVGEPEAARAYVADGGPAEDAHDLGRTAAVVTHGQHVRDCKAGPSRHSGTAVACKS